MALVAYIYRQGTQDFSNRGISATAEQVIVDNIEPERELTSPAYVDLPHVTIIERRFGERIVFHAEPVERKDGACMSGGTFIFSHDSRFTAAIGGAYGAIALHDRFEEYQ